MTSDLPAKRSCVFYEIMRGDSPALWKKTSHQSNRGGVFSQLAEMGKGDATGSSS